MKNFLFLIFVLVFFSCQSDKVDKSPNILFIMSDDHTSQAWGIYNRVLSDYVKNENIKRIANNGATLYNVFCTNSICVPSRASIMTGEYSHQNGVFTLNDSLSHNKLNVSELLSEIGYQTALVGKWHLKSEPKGFDYVEVLPGQGRYHNPKFRTPEVWKEQQKWKEYEGFSADVIADLSLKWLDERNSEKPFFMMTHFKATHEPFDYPERMASLYENEIIPEPKNLFPGDGREFIGQQLEILGGRYESASSDTNSWKRYPGLPVTLPQNNKEERRSAIYQKFIKDFMRSGAAIDENIGRLLDYLEENDLSDNTIIIYTSDQGYFLGEHGFFDKRIMYEEALRMPFIISYPEEIEAGIKIDDIILNIDFPSLFIDYAEGDHQNFGSGKSFRHLLVGETDEDWRKEMYYRYWQHLDIRPAHLGIRTQKDKLIYFYGDPLNKKGTMPEKTAPFWEYYNLENDPLEDHNLIYSQHYKERILELRENLIMLKDSIGDTELEIIPNIIFK